MQRFQVAVTHLLLTILVLTTTTIRGYDVRYEPYPVLIDNSIQELQEIKTVRREAVRQAQAAKAAAEQAVWKTFLGTNAGAIAYELADEYQIPQDMARRWINLESQGDPNCTTGTTGRGLTQLNDNTWPWIAQRMGISDPDPYNVRDNLRMGFWYLHYLYAKYDDNWDAALTAYNRGEGGLREVVSRSGSPRTGYSDRIIGR